MKQLDRATGQFKTVYVKALDSLPVGIILEFPTTDSTKLPNGYMFCDGSAISRVDYAELFGLIGTVYGSGDGSTTFNIPSKEGLVSIGIDSNDTDFDTIGETGGEKKHTLTVDEMPSHNHRVKNDNTGGGSNEYTTKATVVVSNSPNTQVLTRNTGGGQAHNNLQPYTVTNYIIKVKHTRPLAGHIANEYDNSQDSAYGTEYANKAFGGKILWTNPDPTSDMAINTELSLNSSDYDVLEIFFKDRASSSYVQSTRAYKGSNIMLNAIWNTNRLMRLLNYTNDTKYTVYACNSEGGNSASICIPLYIIGYKTGLFN